MVARKEIKIDIPSGVSSGITLKYGGLGQCGVRGGSSGDLLITIKIKDHSRFRVEGSDLFCDLEIKIRENIKRKRRK